MKAGISIPIVKSCQLHKKTNPGNSSFKGFWNLGFGIWNREFDLLF